MANKNNVTKQTNVQALNANIKATQNSSAMAILFMRREIESEREKRYDFVKRKYRDGIS